MKSSKLRQTELLDMLLNKIDECSNEIFDAEESETKGMVTDEANKHYEENSQQFQNAMYECAKIVGNLSYNLKKELGILNNK